MARDRGVVQRGLVGLLVGDTPVPAGSLLYRDGVLERGATRGNGETHCNQTLTNGTSHRIISHVGVLIVNPIHRPNAAIAIHRHSDSPPTIRARIGVKAGVCHASAPSFRNK